MHRTIESASYLIEGEEREQAPLVNAYVIGECMDGGEAPPRSRRPARSKTKE
jgi:hypothetical protein